MNAELDLKVDDPHLHLWQLKKGDRFVFKSTNNFFNEKVYEFVKVDGAYSIVLHDGITYYPHANTIVYRV